MASRRFLLTVMTAAILLGLPHIPQALALDLWARGTPVEPGDGDIAFWQSWQNAHEQFTIHDITYQSDGHNVKAWVLEPKAEGPHPVLLYCRGGGGTSAIAWWKMYDYSAGLVPSLYQRDIYQHAAAGMIVVASNFRDSGLKVADGGMAYNPAFPAKGSDSSSGGEDPFQPSGLHKDPMAGDEVNDVINMLALVQKMAGPQGNGGLSVSADLDRVFMFGHSMGGARAMAALRELSDSEKYASLPVVQKLAVRGPVTDFAAWYKAIAQGRTVFSHPATPIVISARNTGNFAWGYPDDYTSPTAPGYWFYSFFANGPPDWDYSDPNNDAWPDLGAPAPPDYPVGLLYSEEIYYRSAYMWDAFWAANQTPVLVLFGKGDNQILWEDGQSLYDKMTAQGDAALYQLILYEDSDENGPECSFLGSESPRQCDHWLAGHGFGAEALHQWWGLGPQ